MGIVHYFFPWILIHFVYFQESESYSSQINSNTLVGKPQLGMSKWKYQIPKDQCHANSDGEGKT